MDNRRGRWNGEGVALGRCRWFLCARCREPVVIWSRCDHGQRYCGQACSREARRDFQRGAGRRYQDGSSGRAKHAERSRRWRLRRKEQPAPGTEEVGSVTHHGLQELPAELAGVPSYKADCGLPTNPDAAVQTSSVLPTMRGGSVAMGAARLLAPALRGSWTAVDRGRRPLAALRAFRPWLSTRSVMRSSHPAIMNTAVDEMGDPAATTVVGHDLPFATGGSETSCCSRLALACRLDRGSPRCRNEPEPVARLLVIVILALVA